jgi:hypothetical protein
LNSSIKGIKKIKKKVKKKNNKKQQFFNYAIFAFHQLFLYTRIYLEEEIAQTSQKKEISTTLKIYLLILITNYSCFTSLLYLGIIFLYLIFMVEL